MSVIAKQIPSEWETAMNRISNNSAVVLITPAFNQYRAVAALAIVAIGLTAQIALAQKAGVDNAGGSFKEQRVRELTTQAMHHLEHAGGAGSACVELAEMSIMFEPGATEEQIQNVLESAPEHEFEMFIEHSRWLYTATDGNVAQGQPMTLTYSFVPDGTLIPGAYGAPDGPSNLHAVMDANFPGGRTAWKAAFAEALSRWSAISNITFVEVSDDGQVFPSALGSLGNRGDIRIAMRPVGPGPLAYNYYPAHGGDMVMDSLDIATFVNPINQFRSLRNTLCHEHGHGLGLQHVIPQNGTKLMEPALNTTFDGPQEDDVRGVQHQYGDSHESNEGIGDEEFIGGPLRTVAEGGVITWTVENMSLERSTGSDFYGFTAFAGAPIAVRVEPTGSTYEFGPEGGSPQTVNARAVRDLKLRLWRRVSAQTNELQLMAQIDFSGLGEAEYHPPIPYYPAGYILAEVYATDGVNQPQSYTLTISNSPIAGPQYPGELHVYDGTTELGDSSTVYFGQTNIGQSSTRTLTIVNAGEGVLELGQVTIQGAGSRDYSFLLLANEVQPGQSTSMSLTFTPSQPGQRVAVISVPNNDPNRSGFSFIVSGTAIQTAAPQLRVYVDGQEVSQLQTVEFGAVALGDSSLKLLELENAGNAPLNVALGAVGVAGADYEVTPTNVSLAPGESVEGGVLVTPSAEGARTAQLRMVHNGQPTTFTLNLRTTAVAAIVDCNGNGVADGQDIASGTSEDCNANGTPDECETDADGDGVIDGCDQYPGADDNLDTDGDGTVDAADGCPENAAKVDPGVCGCEYADVDTDGDGALDCNDAYPNDPTNGQNVDENDDEEFEIDENDQSVADEDYEEEVVEVENVENEQEQNQREEEEVLEDEEYEEFNTADMPVLGLCGFGMSPALMLSLASLGASRATLRRRAKRRR